MGWREVVRWPWRFPLLRVKRTKTSTPAKGPAEKTVRYATEVGANGAVGGWDADPANAVAVTESFAAKVKAYHDGRPNAGVLEFEEVLATGAQLANAKTMAADLKARDFEDLQGELKRLQAENAELAAALESRAIELRTSDDLRQAAEKTARRVGDENAGLVAQVAELEGQLAAASAPPEVKPKKHK
jgi:hypothetical protein